MKYHYYIQNNLTGEISVDSRSIEDFDGYDSRIEAENEGILKRYDNNLEANIWDIHTIPKE